MYLPLRLGNLLPRSTSMPSNALRPSVAGLGFQAGAKASAELVVTSIRAAAVNAALRVIRDSIVRCVLPGGVRQGSTCPYVNEGRRSRPAVSTKVPEND